MKGRITALPTQTLEKYAGMGAFVKLTIMGYRPLQVQGALGQSGGIAWLVPDSLGKT